MKKGKTKVAKLIEDPNEMYFLWLTRKKLFATPTTRNSEKQLIDIVPNFQDKPQ